MESEDIPDYKSALFIMSGFKTARQITAVKKSNEQP